MSQEVDARYVSERGRARTVGILIFDDVEVLDFCGPFEVFSTARVPSQESDAPLFRAITIAERADLVTCRGGLRVQPQALTADHPTLDLLIVPGGQGTRRERRNAPLLAWIAAQCLDVEVLASVCTGAFLLAESGLLDGLRATTHWASIPWMREHYPRVHMLEDRRVVDEGHIITSAGVSAGIDMSLHVIERMHGPAAAEWTARRMEYAWHDREVQGEWTESGS